MNTELFKRLCETDALPGAEEPVKEILLEQLKKIKKIEPDRDYTQRSRHLILSSREHGLRSNGLRSIVEIFWQSMQFGTTVALAGVLLILIFGGFGIARLISPLQLSSLDVTNLRAEAQAIDIQIQLTDVNYTEPLTLESTQATADPHASISLSQEPARKNTGGNVPTEEGTSTQAIGIDEALEFLAR